jgi:hypothetical protein
MSQWSFRDGLKNGWWRRFVRVDLLCSEYGLTRDELLSAAGREPANHVLSKRDFRQGGLQQPTHLAYNPDQMTPLAPLRATDDLGPQLAAIEKRRRRTNSSTGSSETLQAHGRRQRHSESDVQQHDLARYAQ